MGLLRGAVPVEPDRELARRCAAGDRAAQNELFDREVEGIHATLYRVLGPHRDHEDLVQEAFLEVFRSIVGYRGEAQLSTWIARVTARVAFRYLAKKPPAAAALELVPELASAGPPADRQVLVRRSVRRLYELLEELDPKVRLAFALHVLEGYSEAEVAALMESSRVATKSRIWRARQRLRQDPAVKALLQGAAEEVGA